METASATAWKWASMPLLLALLLIGRHHQQAVGPHGFIALGQSHGVGGVVGTCADDHRDTACHLLDDRLGDLVFFFLG